MVSMIYKLCLNCGKHAFKFDKHFLFSKPCFYNKKFILYGFKIFNFFRCRPTDAFYKSILTRQTIGENYPKNLPEFFKQSKKFSLHPKKQKNILIYKIKFFSYNKAFKKGNLCQIFLLLLHIFSIINKLWLNTEP